MKLIRYTEIRIKSAADVRVLQRNLRKSTSSNSPPLAFPEAIWLKARRFGLENVRGDIERFMTSSHLRRVSTRFLRVQCKLDHAYVFYSYDAQFYVFHDYAA